MAVDQFFLDMYIQAGGLLPSKFLRLSILGHDILGDVNSWHAVHHNSKKQTLKQRVVIIVTFVEHGGTSTGSSSSSSTNRSSSE